MNFQVQVGVKMGIGVIFRLTLFARIRNGQNFSKIQNLLEN